jgi:hypothetical protein
MPRPLLMLDVGESRTTAFIVVSENGILVPRPREELRGAGLTEPFLSNGVMLLAMSLPFLDSILTRWGTFAMPPAVIDGRRKSCRAGITGGMAELDAIVPASRSLLSSCFRISSKWLEIAAAQSG